MTAGPVFGAPAPVAAPIRPARGNLARSLERHGTHLSRSTRQIQGPGPRCQRVAKLAERFAGLPSAPIFPEQDLACCASHLPCRSPMSPTAKFESWLKPDASGLLCEPGGFHIDPLRPVERAIITHGHSDHARPGHGAVLATPETIAVMKARLGADCAGSFQALRYGETLGHRRRDRAPGAGRPHPRQRAGRDRASRPPRRRLRRLQAPRPIRPRRPSSWCRCDLFVTEATFGLPVFRHEPDAREIGRLLASLARLRRPHAPDRRLRPRQDAAADRAAARRRLRQADLAARRARIHVRPLCRARRRPRRPARWSATRPTSCRARSCSARRRPCRTAGRAASPIPVTAFASGWMRVRARARQRGVELPLVISDHCDWPELIADHRRDRRRGDLGHARPRGRAGAPDRPDGQARPGAGAGRLRGRGGE